MSTAISIAPSQYWRVTANQIPREGDDGLWSTFAVQVGTPPQSVRVLPSSSQSSIWLVIPEGCEAPGDLEDCSNKRGVVFDYSNSTTFARVGGADEFFELPVQPEAALGYTGNSIVGHDHIVLDWDGRNAADLASQVVTGFAEKQPFLGVLGLSARPVNITNWADQYDSPLSTLAKNKTIGSAYWAYTAGAPYRTPQAYGSLTLGGYDAARGNVDHVLEVSFGIDTYRDLVLVLKSFGVSNVDGTTITRDLSIWTFIDSTVPEIWLPLSACQAFESAFSLTWDNTTSMYAVNDSLHTQLISRNPSVSFVLAGTTASNAATTTITFPYASFDLTATWPVARLASSESQRYFPLKRAENDSQYVLGRTFLQEAYLAVDYDRSKFHISPATFPDDVSSSNITAVTSFKSEDGTNLGAGPVAGIVLGSAAVLALLMWFSWRWYKGRRRNTPSTQSAGLTPMQLRFDNITSGDNSQGMNGNAMPGSAVTFNHNATNIHHYHHPSPESGSGPARGDPLLAVRF